MYRNTELKTVSKILSSSTSGSTIGGQVSAGMKRWVTFITVDAASAAGTEGLRLYVASVGVSNPTAASLIATGNRKAMIDLRATGKVGQANNSANGPPLQVPARPDAGAPLFSIAASKWMGVFSTLASANVFVQYYDE